MSRKEQDAVRITSASRSHSEDIAHRQRRYVLSMAVRTVLFLAGVLTIPAWYAWLLLVASLFLPYIAVVMANAGSSPDPGGPDPFGAEQHPQLGPGPEPGPGPR